MLLLMTSNIIMTNIYFKTGQAILNYLYCYNITNMLMNCKQATFRLLKLARVCKK